MNRELSVHELEPGMIPDRDLRSRNGRLLVPGGLSLSRDHIRALKIWGVTRVRIRDFSDLQASTETEDHAEQDVQQLPDPELLERAEKMILPRFSLSDLEQPAMKEIFSLAAKRLASRLGRDPEFTLPPQETQTRVHGEILFRKHQNRSRPSDPANLDISDLELSPLPQVTLRLQEALTDPKCSASTLAEIIEQDSDLSQRLLRLTNSSFYNLPIRINSITQAMTVIGLRQMSMMVLGMTVKSIFRGLGSGDLNMKKFWKHCMGCAIAARTLGGVRGGVNTERVFLAGLLHDIGRMVLMEKYPEEMRRAERKARQNRQLPHEAEALVLGTDHALVGGRLLAGWKFSLILEHAVKYHHQPSLSLHRRETALVHIADSLLHACSLEESRDDFVPPVDPETWEAVKLEPEVFALCMRRVDRVLSKKSAAAP